MGSEVRDSAITKYDSETIGFVIACLFSSAIDISELKKWAILVVERLDVDEIPGYIFDLIDFDQPLMGLYKIIGFTPVWERSNDEDAALYGIAVLRDNNTFDMPISSVSALRSLDNNPHIRRAFNSVFPFIDI